MSGKDRAGERARARARRELVGGVLVAVRAKRHGSAHTARNHGCQCAPCLAADQERSAARREAARKGPSRPAVAARRVAEGGPVKLRECGLRSCRKRVPWLAGDTPESYAARKYHTEECAQTAAVPPPRRVGRKAAWRFEVRTCKGCPAQFTPNAPDQEYHSRGCVVKARTMLRRDVKTCECGCTEEFERPAGMSQRDWTARRFRNPEHFARFRAKGSEPGSSRAGKRREPRAVPSKDRAKVKPPAEKPPETAPTVRFGAVPDVQPVVRTVPRPSFGLRSRRVVA